MENDYTNQPTNQQHHQQQQQQNMDQRNKGIRIKLQRRAEEDVEKIYYDGNLLISAHYANHFTMLQKLAAYIHL